MEIFPHKHGPFKVTSSQQIYQNPWIQVREDQVIRPSGSRGLFGIVNIVPGAAVLPFEKGYVWLVREFKYGIGKESLEVISGGIETNELPLEAAQRELSEEIGATAQGWQELGFIDPFTTIVHCPSHLFLAQELAWGDKHNNDGEILSTVRLKFTDALLMVEKSEITHGPSVALIYRAARLLKIL